MVTIALPLGDITANQLRALADIARRFTNETIRTTVEQNIVLRWISQSDLPEICAGPAKPRVLRDPGAATIVDIVDLPGHGHLQTGNLLVPRTCGASCARGWREKNFQFDESVQNLHIKISGCFNSCGQHHVADLGFYGVSRKMAGYAVPHFQVVLGGEWEHNGGSYGMPVMAIPSKHIPEVVTRLSGSLRGRTQERRERSRTSSSGSAKSELKKLLEDLARPPADPADRSIFTDWGDPREYSLDDHRR